MKQITCTVKELFDAIGGNYKYNKPFRIQNNIKIKDENNNWVGIISLFLKKDKIIELIFDDKSNFKAAYNHKAIINKKTQSIKLLKNMHVGDYYASISGRKKILQINKTQKEKDVYDFEIDSNTHLYSTTDGLIHHNSVGIGKSYTVLDELRREEKEFIHITGGIKDSKAFYITLCKHNRPDLILVLDDVNDIIRRRQNVEILRAAVTNEPERPIAYFESKLLIDGIKSYHPRTIFKSKVIIVTNIPKAKIDPAIVSRTSPIEIIANKFDMAPYIEANLEKAPPANVPVAWKKEAWNYIVKEVGLKNIRHLDFRVFEDVMLWLAASKTEKGNDPSAWKKFAYSILC